MNLFSRHDRGIRTHSNAITDYNFIRPEFFSFLNVPQNCKKVVIKKILKFSLYIINEPKDLYLFLDGCK